MSYFLALGIIVVAVLSYYAGYISGKLEEQRKHMKYLIDRITKEAEETTNISKLKRNDRRW